LLYPVEKFILRREFNLEKFKKLLEKELENVNPKSIVILLN
jgi:hypothetical protein